ncbi:LRR receptor-like serine/threonine-protein kinase IOS1 [Fagus crenata]
MDSIFSWLIVNILCLPRYGYDVYDRVWRPNNYYDYVNTSLRIYSQSGDNYQPPSIVMTWEAENATSEYYIYMHFAEVEKLNANQSRSFNITINGNHFYGPVVPQYLYATTVYSQSALMMAKKYEVSIFKTESSTLPPILNAVEIYSVKNLLQSETDQQDGTLFNACMHAYVFYL